MSVKQELETTKMIVESILETNRLARGNDFYLIICYLRAMGVKVPQLTAKQYIALSGSISTVLRVRRIIQNIDGRFKPSKRTVERRAKRAKQFARVKYHEV